MPRARIVAVPARTREPGPAARFRPVPPEGSEQPITHSPHLLTGAFVLDALDEQERTAFADHLEGCSECRQETAGPNETAALLARTVAAHPPPGLRGRILSGIDRLRPLPPVVGTAAKTAVDLDDHRADTAGVLRRPVGLVIAAAVLAVVGAGAASWTFLEYGPAPASAGAQVLQAPDRKHSTVESERGWAATVWHSDSVHQAVIVTTNMPSPPAGMIYQAWLAQPSSGSVSAGLMPTTPDQSLLLQGDAASANGASVTLEPAGGSPTPTSDPVAVFDFGQGA